MIPLFFPKPLPKGKDNSGFTLIEMAVVIVIVGIIISIVATVLPSLIQSAKVKKAQAIMEKTDYALQGYSIANNRLPYADSDNDGDEDNGVYVGNLPYRTLGLSSGTDAWGNSIKYGVYQELTATDSSNFCTVLIGITVYNLSTRIHTTNQGTGQITNQAYILASGGTKDLNENGTDGFFDGTNEGTDLQFDDPSRILFHGDPTSSRYDDLMRALSLAELTQKNCTGGTPIGPGGGVEICDDPGEEDEDNDGYSNCSDQDCYSHPDCYGGPPPDEIQINESPLDSGKVGGTYNDTVMATGGTPPYTWTLVSSQLPGLGLGSLSGNLTGTIDVCAGSYNVTVKVTDTASHEDQHTFSITIENDDHIITPEPTGGTDFSCSSTTCEYDFTVSGLKKGDYFEWSIIWQGTDPGGFQVVRTGEKTAKVQKVSDVNEGAGTYSFQLKAWDKDCPDNAVTSSCCYHLEITSSGLGGPLTANMEAQWLLDECSWNGTAGEVKDSGVNFLDGTAKNGADTLGSGKVCSAGFFDGSDDYLDMGDILNGTLGTTNNSFTISAWIYPLSLSTDQTNHHTQNCFIAKASVPVNDNLEIGVNTNGLVHVYLDTQGKDGYADFGPSGAITLNAWNFVSVTYDNGTVTVTINDSRYENTSTWSGGGNMDDATGSPFTIGSSRHELNYFNGKIDEVMVFSKALDEDEVQSLYAPFTHACSGACYQGSMAEYRMENFPWTGADEEVTDSGSGGSNGKAASKGTGALPTQTSPSSGRVCRAAAFAPVDSNNGGYLDLGDPADGDLDPGTDPWTISAWVKWDGSAGDNIIYNKENLYEARVSGGYVNYAWQPHWNWDGDTSFPVTADTWTYVTTVYDGKSQILFKNGVQVYSRAQTGAMGGNGNKLLIGARGSGNPYAFFGGQIDEIKIYNRALSENELNTDMAETRDCTASGVVITTTSLPSGTINNSYSHTIAATGGTTPYGWEIMSSEIPGLTIVPNTGELNGTTDKCAGDYTIIVRVTDAGSRSDERSFTLTVGNGILTISPSSPKTFNCTTSDFYRDFSVSGSRMSPLENWTITWLGTNPGGFEIIRTGDSTAKFRKNSTSTAGNGYQFKLTANDSICADNTVDSGYYTLNIGGNGTNTPYYAGHLGEWWLDENPAGGPPQMTDHSGQNNHGTVNGTIASVQGKVWAALQFDGLSGYVDCGNNTSLDIDTNPADVPQDFTIGAWVKAGVIPVTGSNGYFVDKGTGSLVDGYGLAIIGNQFAFITDGNGASGGKSTLLADGAATPGTWYYIAGVRESGVKKLYVNKVLQSATPTDARELSDTSRHFFIGKPDADGGYFQGMVDEVVFYNRALSQSEITDLYNKASLVAYYKMDETSGSIYDYSGKNNHGTNYGAGYGAAGRVGYALDFDGTDYVNVGDNGNLTRESITIAAWVKATQLDNWNGIITNKPDTNHGINLQMGTAQNIAALVGNGSACTYVMTAWPPSVDTWYHVVITHNGSDDNNILYVDGNKEAEKTYVLAYSLPVDTIIGRFYTPSLPFKGLIDEVRIYDRVLSGDEVKELYNKGVEEGN